MSTIVYRTKAATEAEIATHLSQCAAGFIPPLDQRINIAEYAAKLFAKAVSFEAWNDGLLEGLIACYFNSESKQAYITSVSVSKALQGGGVALQLLLNCLQYGKQHGMKTIRLEVNKDNLRAINFYERNGFAKEEANGNSFFMFLSLKDMPLNITA
ncbi:GNAT family N-acetyltransferase [Flavisolibacter ginsenosidimutans]|uniref:GNAT family N-acetyltransferase n=1 Tax=Flavisolibacter ginsenosidimutans TaxID=661481 RepID=A0A5B8UDV8_9BACT|nr:GNAT family N-acetyltransferase [Flavisolibacter ginsenosidimutans]QEC54871.1 GNAT family N-acetyltransferase [Flavisolibacter ginsenosidimutans]